MSIAEHNLDAFPQPARGGRPIRVCYLIDNLAVGGTEKQLLALIAHLDRTQVRPYLCLLDGNGEMSRSLEPTDCQILRLGVRSLRSARTVSAGWRFVRFLRQHKIDVVQLHFPDSTYFGAPLARLAGVRCVLRTRRNTGYWMTSSDRRMGRFISHLVDGTVANSEACRDAVIEQEGANGESIHVIPNGIELGPASRADSATTDLPSCPKRIGVVSNLRPVKNLEVFVRAAAELAPLHDNLTFHIAGTGECQASLEQLAIELGLSERLFFHGAVADVSEFVRQLDVAVLSSRAEGFSNAILEYMAHGKPIVASAVGGNIELIQNETTGLLVDVNDAPGLASAIDRILTNPELSCTLAINAQLRANDFCWPVIGRQYCQLYKSYFSRSGRIPG